MGLFILIGVTEGNHGSIRDLWSNMNADNHFTNFELVEKLLNHRSTYVGTVRKNKRVIPNEFIAKKREAGISLFGFDQYTTLVSYAAKKNRSVLLLSTIHHGNHVDKDTGKPDIIHFHCSTKGAVDTTDQLCHSYSVQRKSKKWPIAYFMNTINLAGINAFICFLHADPKWNSGKLTNAGCICVNLAKTLKQPYLHARSQNLVGVTRTIQDAMAAGTVP